MRKLLILLVLCFASLSFAQDSIDPELAEQIDSLEAATVTLRGLEPLEEVALAFPNRAEVTAYLESSFEEFYTPEIVAQEMAFYTAFGFIPADFDFLAGLTALYSDQVAGYYDTEELSMNVIMTGGEAPTTFLPLLDQIIYVHEFTHALQDQHFDLDVFLEGVEGDAALARLALVEGDATAVMSLYTAAVAEANPFTTLLQLGAGMAQMGNSTLPEGTPEIIGEELTFPYLQGQSFVTALIEEGGWEAVNAAYLENPPLSSEQILHPERYLAGDGPTEVSFEVAVDGWELMKSGVFGEFYLRQWLGTLGMEREFLNSAASGWGGDQYHVFAGEAGTAFALQIVFDSHEDQMEFFSAVLGLDWEMTFDGDLMDCWAGNQSLCMTMLDDTSLRLSSAPDEDTARMLAGQ